MRDVSARTGRPHKSEYLTTTQAAAYLADLLQQRDFSGVVNVCSGRPISVRSLVERHCAARDSRIALNLGHYPYPTHEPMAFWGDARLLRALLGAEHEA